MGSHSLRGRAARVPTCLRSTRALLVRLGAVLGASWAVVERTEGLPTPSGSVGDVEIVRVCHEQTEGQRFLLSVSILGFPGGCFEAFWGHLEASSGLLLGAVLVRNV
eukprot:6688305-Pyramimonas_sp.AAC.1